MCTERGIIFIPLLGTITFKSWVSSRGQDAGPKCAKVYFGPATVVRIHLPTQKRLKLSMVRKEVDFLHRR